MRHETEEDRWAYNVEDCIRTREVGETLAGTIKSLGLEAHEEFQQAMFWPVLKAMLRGVRVDLRARAALSSQIDEQIQIRRDFLRTVAGHDLNPNSPAQLVKFFYDDLGQTPIKTRAKKGIPGHLTVNDEALTTIAAREPLLKPLIDAIGDIRTLRIFLSNYIEAKLDYDGRLRCSYNICGTLTYRLSSSQNAFNGGCNFQNIPSDKSKSLGKAAKRNTFEFQLPNIRSMIIPDEGFTFFDLDLDRADLQVVVWEADDAMLKAALRLGVDIHLLNCYAINGKEPPPLAELVETHPRYADHRGPLRLQREFSKVFCHACVTEDHEVLTPEGWVLISEITNEQQIAVWNKETEQIFFEKPSSWNRDEALPGEVLISFEGQAFSQLVTSDHRMPYTTDNIWRVTTADDVILKASARFPKSGFFSGERSLTCAALTAAFIADGSTDPCGNVTFHFHKERKKVRLRQLLKGREYSEYPDRFYVPRRSAEDFTVFGKDFGPWLLLLDAESLDKILEETEHWDGSKGRTNAVTFSSVKQQNIDWLRTIAHLRGKASQFQGSTISGFGSEVYRCSINNRPKADLASMCVKKIPVTVPTAVYCPQTSTGFFLVKRKGKISVTGNTNYVGSARTVASHTGRLVHEIDRAQKLWFGAHPGIKRWHERVAEQVAKRRFVENRFGQRWYIFDRLDAVLPEAVAWIPQSTVGRVINTIWKRFHDELPHVETLLQVHDSLGGQFPTWRKQQCLDEMLALTKVVVPYDDPLMIPAGIATSEVSWGDCH